MTVTIRVARVSDAKGIRQMWRAGLASTFVFTGSNSLRAFSLQRVREQVQRKGQVLFVALREGVVVGSASYAWPSSGRLRHRAEFGWCVHPDAAGQGIGTQLLVHALADAKKHGFRRAQAEMAVKNVASLKLALRCGFKVEGRMKKALRLDDGKFMDTFIVGQTW